MTSTTAFVIILWLFATTCATAASSGSGNATTVCEDAMASNVGRLSPCAYSCASLRTHHGLPYAKCVFIKANATPAILSLSQDPWSKPGPKLLGLQPGECISFKSVKARAFPYLVMKRGRKIALESHAVPR